MFTKLQISSANKLLTGMLALYNILHLDVDEVVGASFD